MSIGKDDLVVVAGVGGFIGGWVVRHLLEAGARKIRAVDLKPFDDSFQRFSGVENIVADLRETEACKSACRDAAAATPTTR